jgi:ketosteroid isomerase-like protein
MCAAKGFLAVQENFGHIAVCDCGTLHVTFGPVSYALDSQALRRLHQLSRRRNRPPRFRAHRPRPTEADSSPFLSSRHAPRRYNQALTTSCLASYSVCFDTLVSIDSVMEPFMKRMVFLLSAMVVSFFAATSHYHSNAVAIGRTATVEAVDVGAQNRAADTAELTRLAMEAGHAYAQRDLPSLEHLTADDFVQTDVRGAQQNRAQWLDFVRNRKSELRVETSNVQVNFYGGAAVVRGHWMYTRKENGRDLITYSQWTSVWTRENGSWKRHAFQNTYVNPNADRCALDPPH